MTTRVTDLFPSGTLAARPDPATVPIGGLYASSDDKIIYKNVAGVWAAWAVLTGSTDPEVVRDTMAAALVQGAGAILTPDDAGNTITVAADPEFIRDTIGAALVQGTGVSISVNDAGDTITISTSGAATRTVNTQTGTAYTLAAGDAGAFVTMTNSAASTLTVPTNATAGFAIGTVIEGAQLGAGQVTIAGASGVTVNATPGLKVAAQYGTFGLLKTATDAWLAFGRLSA